MAVIVAAFMAGLGVGSHLGGALSLRLSPQRALQAFGLLEVLIAVCGEQEKVQGGEEPHRPREASRRNEDCAQRAGVIVPAASHRPRRARPTLTPLASAKALIW
ncbi:MAG TPA: hypothetical protein VE359_20500 [Vicinamibacteria bacterium]|nr:hypothetical protein [Vicinamibacteria bacterium]